MRISRLDDSESARSGHRRGVLVLAATTVLALIFSAVTVSTVSAAEITHTIADVQGDGAETPLSGTTVTVQGVVTGDYRASSGSGYRGFFVQDPEGDPTDDNSDGIFIFAADADPDIALGDLITVTGAAGEFRGQTQITADTASAYTVVTPEVGVPEATLLPESVVGADREVFEGMLVTPETAYLSSSHQLYNFGTLWLGIGELAVKATETTDAGEAAHEIAAANRARRLLVDDGYSIQVSNAAHPGTQPYFDAETVVRNGDRFIAPEGGMILGWGFDDWRLQPQRPLSSTLPAADARLMPSFESVNLRPAAPDEVGGDFSVGTFNVFNYFTTFGGEARGADNAEDFAVQQSKIVSAINSLDADVVALMEIENSIAFDEPADEALSNLVDALNEAAGSTVWAFVPTPTSLLDSATTDVITNAIIYQTETASPVGESFADIDETVWDIAREPIAQTFEVNDKIITVVANHLKSKSPPSGGGTEPSDLQGFFNAERVEQTTSLVSFVDGIAADPEKGPDVMLLGDFNAYHEEDPSQVLTDAGFVDLVPEKTDEYTYTFDGELGSLDHAFASPSLASSVTGVDVWNINSSEWSDRGYAFDAAEEGTPFRSSDHDPVKIGLDADSQPGEPVTIDLLSVNDFHGRLEATPPAAGAAVLAGMVNSYRAANPNTVFVGVGDLIGASTFTSFIQKDQPTIDAFNAMGLQASALGNHEFDAGRADLDQRILPAADWDSLSANIYDRATGKPAYEQYYIQSFGDVSIGFIGATTEDLSSLVSPAGIKSLEIKPVVEEVNRVADALSDGTAANGEADVLVLLVHEGAATPDIASSTDDSPFGQIVTGANANIDAIISGHTHLGYDHEIPIPGTQTLRPVMSSGQYGEQFSHTAVSLDPETGELLSISAEVLPLAGAYPPDPEVATIVADAVATAAEQGAVPVGEITASFTRAQQTDPLSENRGGESTLGNFIADVQLSATRDSGADIALMNPGGLRADLSYESSGSGDPDGTVTFAEAAAVQPFANTLVTLDLTGDQLRQVLEQQWQPEGASRPFLKLGASKGFDYSYIVNPPVATATATATTGTITAMSLDGKPVLPNDVVTVAANSFLASGGDNFTALTQGTKVTDTGKVDLQSLVDYLKDSPVNTPDYAQRAVGVSLSEPDADGYSAGDTVTMRLSSLLFSNGGPAAGTVVVSADDVELGTADIDPAIVDTTDEGGRASVAVTIPSETPAGTLQLMVTVPETGTAIEVPLEVTATQPIKGVTSTAGSVNRRVVFGNQALNYTVRVKGEGEVVPTGQLVIYDGNRALKTITLTAADEGRVTVPVTGLSRGIHLLKARYAGNEQLQASVSAATVVLKL
ncbi:MAG: ExeM/NucH family extracellular endonuclease [Rhodoglobus sp.]